MANDLTVIRCFNCSGEGSGPPGTGRVVCRTCQGIGSVFWVDGRALPYTPEGEKRAASLFRISQET